MKRSEIRLTFASILVCVFASSCSHIAHRAGVEPGINTSLLYAPSFEHIDHPKLGADPNEKFSGPGYTDIQFNLGYAWEFDNNRRFLLQGMFFANPHLIPSLDLYWQFSSAPEYSNGGFGAILGPDAMAYFLWGRDLIGRGNDDFRMGVDVGTGVAVGPSFLCQPMISFYCKGLTAGLFSEYRYFLNPRNNYDYDKDYDPRLRSRIVGGVILFFSPSRR